MSSSPPDSQNLLSREKERLRRDAFARRDGLSEADREAASRRIAERVAGLIEGSAPVGTYWPIRSEVDTRPLIEGLAEAGIPVALSRIADPHLSWHLWRPGEPLELASLGVPQPAAAAPPCRPGTLLVPLAAFDRRGARLGYGRGHFDRAIAALVPVRVIGLAFAVQEFEAVPQEPHDRPLDLIVTEREVVAPLSS